MQKFRKGVRPCLPASDNFFVLPERCSDRCVLFYTPELRMINHITDKNYFVG